MLLFEIRIGIFIFLEMNDHIQNILWTSIFYIMYCNKEGYKESIVGKHTRIFV